MRLIDADELIEGRVSNDPVAIAAKCATTVDAVPVVHARWMDNGNGTISCSRCNTWYHKEREPYLLWCLCGARMDGGEK